MTWPVAAGVVPVPAPATARQDAITDAEYWRLVTVLSEPGGAFSQQLMSNEDSAQVVVPALQAAVAPGGVYIGVGSEQNFTYVAALRPRLAFVVDIRRENMLEMLMYRALFEVCADRADFISSLFARPRPAGVTPAMSAADLFARVAAVAPQREAFDANVRRVLDTLTRTHGWPLPDADTSAIADMMNTFRTAGPDSLKGWGDRTNATFAQLMAATDLAGREQGFLASEDRYRTVRDLQRRNLIVPVVGDFAGDHALAGLAQYLKERRATVAAFYVSNVERYLFEQGPHGQQFYTNVAALPLAPGSVFIRSVTRDISQRLGIVLPAGTSKWWTFVTPIQDCLDGIAQGRIRTYAQIFAK